MCIGKKWDLKATQVVTGYDRVVTLRVRNARTAWDRGSLRASKVCWRTERRRGARFTMGHPSPRKDAWCKICGDKVVEDTRHYMCQCGHEGYQRIRKAWYDKVRVRIGRMSPEILGALQAVMVIRNGMLENGQDVQEFHEMTAWGAMSGRIPDIWTKTLACRMKII